jgi:hypothetical protein
MLFNRGQRYHGAVEFTFIEVAFAEVTFSGRMISGDCSRGRVLIAGDDTDFVEVVRRRLSKAGHEAVAVTSARPSRLGCAMNRMS